MSPSPARRELRTLILLSSPIALTQLASMAMGAVDVLMLGNYSKEALAAGSLGRVWVMGTQLAAQGVLFGIDPLIAQAHGARNARASGLAFQRGLILAFLVSVPLILSWTLTAEVLGLANIDPELANLAETYALGRAPGVLFFLLFMVQRSWLQSRRILAPALIVVLVANVMNWFADLALIHGRGPFPELGVFGAGLATSATQVFLFAGLTIFILRLRLDRGGWTGWSKEAWDLTALKGVLRIGLPIALQLGLEIWAFQIATLMSGNLGETEVAAHAVVMTLASLSFMVPLGIGMGAQTRVGNLLGAGEGARAELAARVALRAGSVVMLGFALTFILGSDVLPPIFSSDLSVVAYAAIALPIAGLFQLFDGVQVIASCTLRGAGRTRVPLWFNLIGYYAIGLPLAYLWAFVLDWGFPGVWFGLAAGLGVIAPLLVIYVARVFRDAGEGRLQRL